MLRKSRFAGIGRDGIVSSADVVAPAGRAGDVVELAVAEAVHGGWCVARPAVPAVAGTAGGPVVFVRHALPGERVRAVLTQVTARLARADAVEILSPSPDRVTPPCPHAGPGKCGGCDWQHATLEAQRRLKGEIVAQQLRRIAGLEAAVAAEELPGSADGLAWRTRVRYAVGPHGAAGFYRHRSHEVEAVGECAIAHPLVNQAGVTARRWPPNGFVDVAAAPETGQVAVVPSGGGPAGRDGSGGAGRRGGAAGRGGSGHPGRPGWAAERRSGPEFLSRQAAGLTWRVAAGGFWQTHPGAADALADAVLAALAPRPGETALDLYCGAGLFAGVLARAVGPEGTVIAVEQDPGAVRDARRNLRPMSWARVHRGDAAEVLGRIGLAGASLVVLDPPRTGLSRELIGLLSGTGTNTGTDGGTGRAAGGRSRVIGYVSCDPATLARDLAEFAGRGWRLAGLRAFDAFPMTHHVEVLATLVPA